MNVQDHGLFSNASFVQEPFTLSYPSKGAVRTERPAISLIREELPRTTVMK